MRFDYEQPRWLAIILLSKRVVTLVDRRFTPENQISAYCMHCCVQARARSADRSTPSEFVCWLFVADRNHPSDFYGSKCTISMPADTRCPLACRSQAL